MKKPEPPPHFEMADASDPESIILAAQRSVIVSMRQVIADIKMLAGGPGMTWDQLEFFLNEFEKKKPHIIQQEGEF